MNQDLVNMVTEQIAFEQYSVQLYRAMSHAANQTGLLKFAKLLAGYALEEDKHAVKWIDFLADRNAPLALKSIDAPPKSGAFLSLIELCEAILAHEQKVTARIFAIHEAACDGKDPLLKMLSQWFLAEQIEEEKKAFDLVALARLCKQTPALFDSMVG